ncbi:MAG: selenocysteine-specific translation elongation factor [Anaerolineae bacterium]|nr:selenocysteine-specific translation elongation factor [Anaerolineae bacterium]
MRVIGTAGHVDHGKSALILALTGIDPDRLREEQERGLTIDLGFAWLVLPNGEPVGIVDVPGHRDFIENMLAGIGSIDGTIFVVAADESVMPQTREHLAILDLLEIDTGVVAITKTDLVESEEWLDLVVEDAAETLAGTVLEDAPVVLTSARTRRGLDRLLAVLQSVLGESEPHLDRGRPRLSIDRVFTVSGFGTVVTGTLIDGCLETGQEVEILPDGLRARIRGLQTHKEKIEHAIPGSRVAINLSGIDKDQLQRGDVVASPGWLHATTLVDVRMRYLPDILWPDLGQFAQRPLRHNTELKFYTGAAQVMARVRLLGREALLPEEIGWVQLELQEPVAMMRGDRYIARLPSPPTTVGGGIVVDPNPGRKHRRFRSEAIDRLETLAEGSPSEILLQTLQREEPVPVGDLLKASRLGDAASDALSDVLSDGRAVLLGRDVDQPLPDVERLASTKALAVSHVWWSRLVDRVKKALSSYHQRWPLRQGMPREALRSNLGLTPHTFDAAMARAHALGVVLDEGSTVRLVSHRVEFTPQQQQRVEALMSRFRQHPYAPPSIKESIEAVGEDVFRVLLRRGELVQASPDVVFLSETYEDMVSQIRTWIERKGSITLAEVRDRFNSSRKYAQALLEHLDEVEITKRVGDRRVLR